MYRLAPHGTRVQHLRPMPLRAAQTRHGTRSTARRERVALSRTSSVSCGRHPCHANVHNFSNRAHTSVERFHTTPHPTPASKRGWGLTQHTLKFISSETPETLPSRAHRAHCAVAMRVFTSLCVVQQCESKSIRMRAE